MLGRPAVRYPSSMPLLLCWASQRRGHTWRTVFLNTGVWHQAIANRESEGGLCGRFDLFLRLMAENKLMTIFDVPFTFGPVTPSVVRRTPPLAPPRLTQHSCTRGCTTSGESIRSSSNFEIRIADTVGFKIVYGQFLKVPPTKVLTLRARLSEVRLPSHQDAFLYEPQS